MIYFERCPDCDMPGEQCECEEFTSEGEHEAWCHGYNCDGWVDMEGGFVRLRCLCLCHEEREVFA